MAWIKGQTTDYRTLMEILHDFASKTTEADAPVPDGGNTGDGTMYGSSSTHNSVAEDFTITCTTAGPDAVFSVTGSVSGSLAVATSNQIYSEDEISFCVIDGATDFIIGDEFTFSVSSSTALWTAERYDHTPSEEYELIMKGLGYSELDEIFVGFQSYEELSNYGWRINGFTGYNPGADFLIQPGSVAGDASPWDHHFTPMSSLAITYWLFVSPQRIMGTVLSGAIYTSFHSGWIDPYASPSQYGYPMMVGSASYSLQAYTSTDSDLRNFWHPRSYDGAHVAISILDSEEWRPSNQYTRSYSDIVSLWPNNATGLQGFQTQPDGRVPSFDQILSIYSDSQAGVYGKVEGIKCIPNLSGTITPEDLVETEAVGSDPVKANIVFQNCFRAAELILFTLDGDN